jgi:Na+-driven multidrug efflux pump
VAVGFPGSLEHVVRTVAGFLLVVLLTGFGPAVLSAYTSGNIITMTLIFPGVALGQATAALIGQSLGAGRPDRAWRTAWAAAGLYGAFMTALGVVIWLLAGPLVGFFDDNPAVVAEGERLLRIMVTCFPLLGVALTLSRAFAGAGSTVPAMVVAALAHLVVQIPLARVLAGRFGPPGAYWAMSTAFMVHGLLSAGLFFHRFRRWRTT